jgi:hypothetical protein
MGFTLNNPDPHLADKNKETLMALLKKCKELTLHRIEKTFVVYEFINLYSESFQHIQSLTLEFHLPFLKYLKYMTKLKNVRTLKLN